MEVAAACAGLVFVGLAEDYLEWGFDSLWDFGGGGGAFLEGFW